MESNEFKSQAAITLSNYGGIEIMFNRSNDAVFYRFNYGQDLKEAQIYEREILYSPKTGQPYFDHFGTRYYLNDAIRINN